MMLRKKLLCNVNRQRISFLKSLVSGSRLWLASPELTCLGLAFPFSLDPGNSCLWLWDVTSFFFSFFSSFFSWNVKKFRHKNVATGKTQFVFFFHFFLSFFFSCAVFFVETKEKGFPVTLLALPNPRQEAVPGGWGSPAAPGVSRAFPQFLFR